MLHLHLLRHAKTNQLSPTGKDFDRELLPKGHLQCAEMKTFLSDTLQTIDAVLCSTAKRAQQTHDLIGLSRESTYFSRNLYLCTPLELLQELSLHAKGNAVLIVGHNDGLSELASYLCEDYIHLQTCGYVQLELQVDDWSALSKGTAILKNSYRPKVD